MDVLSSLLYSVSFFVKIPDERNILKLKREPLVRLVYRKRGGCQI